MKADFNQTLFKDITSFLRVLVAPKSIPSLVLVLLFFFVTPLVADDAEGTQEAPTQSLYKLFAGNTLSGLNTTGVVFSEYHAPDGRIFGYNSVKPDTLEPAINACWKIVGVDTICYYYGEGTSIKGEFCWKFKSAGKDEVGKDKFEIYSTDTRTTGIISVEKGNPQNFGDHGKPWSCLPLSS